MQNGSRLSRGKKKNLKLVLNKFTSFKRWLPAAIREEKKKEEAAGAQQLTQSERRECASACRALKAVKLDLSTERERMDGWVTASSTPASRVPVAPKPPRRSRQEEAAAAGVPLRQRGEEERRGSAEIRRRSTIPDRTAVTSTPPPGVRGRSCWGGVGGWGGGRVDMPRLPGGTSEAENMQ